jgi:hypothetical protein
MELIPVQVAFAGWPFALVNITSRHHSPNVLAAIWAARSNWAYSSSLTFVPMDLVRRLGFTISVTLAQKANSAK